MRLDFRANDTTHDATDWGYYILVDAASTVWNEPALSLDGVRLTNVKDATSVHDLNPHEEIAWSGYEYIYFVNKPITDDLNKLSFDIKSLSGVNPGASDDIEIDITGRGAFESINGADILISGFQDDSLKTSVFTVQDFTIDIS